MNHALLPSTLLVPASSFPLNWGAWLRERSGPEGGSGKAPWLHVDYASQVVARGGGRGPWTREMLIFVHAHASSLSLSLTHLSLARSLSLFICQSIYLSFSSSHHHLHVHHSINICPLSLFSLSLYSHLYHHLDHYLYQFDDMKLRSRNAQTKNVAHFFSSLSFSFFNSL